MEEVENILKSENQQELVNWLLDHKELNTKTFLLILERVLDTSIKMNNTDDQVCLNNIILDDIDHKFDIDSEVFWVWIMSTLKAGITFILFNDYSELSDNRGNGFTIDENGRVVFDNKNKPCVIHAPAHRNLQQLCKLNEIECIHKKR